MANVVPELLKGVATAPAAGPTSKVCVWFANCVNDKVCPPSDAVIGNVPVIPTLMVLDACNTVVQFEVLPLPPPVPLTTLSALLPCEASWVQPVGAVDW